jgi:carbamoyl-phosphate synthase small subunit
MTALLALEDGSVWRGHSCGAPGEARGEIVFNTAMTGYQEVLTDPSYKGQLVTMTYPLIGNYGITARDHESRKPFLEGFIVRELCRYPSNWESIESAGQFLQRQGVVAIEGVDTRAITRRVRDKGALRAILSTTDLDAKSLLRRVKEIPSMVGRDLASEVTCETSYCWNGEADAPAPEWPLKFTRAPHVVLMDFGAKHNIMRCLTSMGCRVTVVPARTTSKEIVDLRPDGIMLSNGPGDPEPVDYAIETIKRLIKTHIPLFGICLGHQLLALALGAKTFKLKFGHHGANHPVKDLSTGKIEITAQNHGFCVDRDSLPGKVRATHINLNDKTCEGLEHTKLPVFSVQHHPEAAGGPHDARYLFTRFGNLIQTHMEDTRKPNRRVSSASEGENA